MLDLHFVTPDLALGGRFPMEAAAVLAVEHGIRRVVDVRREACDDEEVLRRHGIRLLHLPTDDTCAIDQEPIRRGVSFVCEGLELGERALVHCQHGIGRSALLALCVLVARGDSPAEALERAKQARRVVSPSPDQLRAFIAFAEDWKAERDVPWEVPSLRDLGVIAWRHLFQDRDELDADEARASSTRAG